MNDAKAETPVLWPPHAKSWLIGKDSDAGRDWGQEEKGTTEDEMAGWYHWLDGHESEWTPGAGDGQGGLACCDSWGCRVRHDWATELNWTRGRKAEEAECRRFLGQQWKEMAAHSSVLAWRIPGVGEPGGAWGSRTRLSNWTEWKYTISDMTDVLGC